MTATSAVTLRRKTTGQMAHHSGLSAEARIAQDYQRRGFFIAHERWRGEAGEIDLIARNSDGVVFVEVKKSGSFARAADALSLRQMQRIYHSAEAYLAEEPCGQLTNVRFDVALVNGQGEHRIIENAFGHG